MAFVLALKVVKFQTQFDLAFIVGNVLYSFSISERRVTKNKIASHVNVYLV